MVSISLNVEAILGSVLNLVAAKVAGIVGFVGNVLSMLLGAL